MKPDKVKELFFRVIDPVFYPDISQARRVSRRLLEATRRSDPGVTIAIDQTWRNQTVTHELRFNLSESRQWFINLAKDIDAHANSRNRQGIERAINLLSGQGAILN